MISSIIFGSDISTILTASMEIKVIGLKSLKVIKEFPGHSSRVNDLLITEDGSKVISG